MAERPAVLDVSPNMRLGLTAGTLFAMVAFAIIQTDRIATWRTTQEMHSAHQDEKIAKLASDAVEDRKVLMDAVKALTASIDAGTKTQSDLRLEMGALRTSMDTAARITTSRGPR